MRYSSWVNRLSLILGFSFIYLPIVILILHSFNASRLVSITGVTILGTLSAIFLARFGCFYGRSLFNSILLAPMAMPEVVLGVSILLMFVTLGIDRGIFTITIAHITFTRCFAYVVVQSRLAKLDPSLEEAAIDLGCSPTGALSKLPCPISSLP